MDVSKLKAVAGKLSIIRDYSSLLIPVAIVLAAVFFFVPGQFISGKLNERIENESISRRARKIASLSGDPVPSGQWRLEQAYQSFYEDDANRIAQLAKQSSQRELLSYRIFPEPRDTSALIFEQFGQQYRRAIDELIVRVKALDCPTNAELERNLQRSSTSGFDTGIKESSVVNETIKDELCRAKAESALVYANVTDFAGYDYWNQYEYTGISKSVEDCWYWQLGYWIIEDVIDTVAACNKGSDNVFTSQIKRIMGINFVASGRQSIRRPAGDRPGYVRLINEGLTNPYTGRLSDDDIDVVHFNIVVLVSAKAVLPFMQELCSAKSHVFRGWSGQERPQAFRHNQITILESKISSVDRDDSLHNLYRYGEDAVVSLDLICEYIFNKSGYDEVKPESVKETLAAKEP